MTATPASFLRVKQLTRFSLALAGIAGSVTLGFAQSANATSSRAAATPNADEAIKLEVFKVQETKGQSYGASNLASATRMNTPIENVPQTIMVMNANLLADIGSHSLDQALRYTPGATPRQNSPDGAIVRGLASGFAHYEDGYFAPAIASDLGNIDRVELIKGPSASIAGASESTGFLNFITKKPLFTDRRSADVTVGSWNFVRGVVDVTGAVPGYGNMAYRIVGSYVNADSFRDNERTKKTAVYPSFTWRLTKDSELLAQIASVSNFTPGGFGSAYLAPTFGAGATPIVVPANARIRLNRWMPINVNSSGAAGMGRNTDLQSLHLVFTHRLNEIFSFRQSGKLYTIMTDLYRNALADNFTYDADGYLIGTYAVNRSRASTQAYRFQGDAAMTLKSAGDKFTMRTLAGYEIARSQSDSLNFQSANGVLPFNFLAPIYDAGLPTSLLNTGNSNSKGGSFATFANTQVGLFNDYAILTAGVRRDQNKAGWTKNNLNNTRANTPKTPVITSPLFGLTIKPAKWVALFGVYSNAGAAATTVSTFPGLPVTEPRQILVSVTPDTTNKEFGAKFTFFKGNFSISASHFDTLQSGVTRNQTDPSFPGGSMNFIDSGNRSRGFDISWAGDVTANLSIFGGYVFNETSAPGFKPNGSQLELRGTPKNKIQMFARYQFKQTKDGGFAVKAGVVSQTSVFGRASNTYSLPGATRYDIGLDYRNDSWSFAAGLVNLTNVIFPTFAVGQGSNTIDDPRNFYFTVGRKF
jgi:outer membrane receptor protein involved in Fe transport